MAVHSHGGTGRAVSPGLTPPPFPLPAGRGYCPALRGQASTATPTVGLGPLTVTNAVRSPSVNRLGSLFNSINRSVTSAFSGFVAVNQPVPGVIQDRDHPTAPLSGFTDAFRRASGPGPTTTQRPDPHARQTSVDLSAQQCRPAVDERADGRDEHVSVRPVPLQGAPATAPRRPRGGLPINHHVTDPQPPYTNQLPHRNRSQRGNVLTS